MKKIIFGCMIAGFCGSAPIVVAQDYCCPTQYNPCCYDDSFGGFYVGGNVGAISHIARRNDTDGFASPDYISSADTDVTAGVQVGYDWQCRTALVGIVADWNWTNIDRTVPITPNSSTPNTFKTEFDWFTTIRARAGLTVCDALVYVTAGAAVARVESQWTAGTPVITIKDTEWGWTGGMGAEFLLGCNFSLGAEVLFLHFDDYDRTIAEPISGNTFTFINSDSSWVGRITLNYRFGDLCCWW